MRGRTNGKAWPAAICAVALGLSLTAPSAQAAPSDPLFVFIPSPPPPSTPPKPIVPPPTGYLNGPCGLGVDSGGRFYVSDYYHDAVDVFTSTPVYVTQLPNVDPLDGPCGLALDATNRLYVNDYHRAVIRYGASPSFGTGAVITGAPLDASRPTGVAVDPISGDVYVNQRDHVAVYDSTGVPVLNGGEPLSIGLGTLEDGYGVAVSQFPGTFGRVYVPDAGSNIVKAYDPAISTASPVATIKLPGNKPFVSLRDAAIAVDRVSGDLYVADDNQPAYAERPQATIHIFNSTGGYKGHLKYNVITARPPGLAVDNSPLSTQGRVYVTSGNTNQAGVYAYPPGAATTAPPLPSSFALAVSSEGSGEGTVMSSLGGIDCATACEAQIRSGVAVALTAIPEGDSTFTDWSGACSGAQQTCTVTMDEAISVSASFAGQTVSTPTMTSSSSPPAVSAVRSQRSSRRKARCRRAAKRRHRSAQRRRGCRRQRRARSR